MSGDPQLSNGDATLSRQPNTQRPLMLVAQLVPGLLVGTAEIRVAQTGESPASDLARAADDAGHPSVPRPQPADPTSSPAQAAQEDAVGLGSPNGVDPNNTCLQIVNQFEDLRFHFEGPAEQWRGRHTDEVVLAFRQIAAEVRRQELASTCVQAAVRRMLARRKFNRLAASRNGGPQTAVLMTSSAVRVQRAVRLWQARMLLRAKIRVAVALWLRRSICRCLTARCAFPPETMVPQGE